MADQRVMRFGFSLPPEQLLKNGVQKPLMRRALANRLPPEILAARARGLQGADWYEQIRKSEVDELLEEVRTSDCVQRLIDLNRVRSAVQNWPESDWGSLRVTAIYRRALTLTLSTAVFIHEFEKVTREGDFSSLFSSSTIVRANG
jgi:asparagine synthase (glutamine-hydrolysing)